MKKLNYSDVKKQSEAVYKQFGESMWKPYANENHRLKRCDCKEFENSGLGKTLVLVAMGASLENDIEELKKNREKYDILTCDKGFGVLLEHGIKADFVNIADCQIPYKWLEKYIDETEDVALISTIYANPDWTSRWKGKRYFYMNKDAIKSEKHFSHLFPNARTIPASSNVGNAMLVFMTGCDNGQANWAGYDRYVLLGYDFCWLPEGNYYAFNNPKPKRSYMHHLTRILSDGTVIFSSQNLNFSADWLRMYIKGYKLPVIDCSGGMLEINQKVKFSEVVSKINSNYKAIELVRNKYDKLKLSFINHNKYMQDFNKSREALWQ